jgi:AraC family transcriptional regulator
MTAAARLSLRGRHHEGVPPWLGHARELLHAHFRERLDIARVAAEVGVHPSHLAHAFRRHFVSTPGEYARALRLSWAVDRLVEGDEPISAIAVSAGYSDQSHFTRECRKALGVGPGEYRRLRRS